MRYMCLYIAIAVLSAIAFSCSPRKNTAASRNYQAFITRYNVYYNGDEHYKMVLKDMEKNYEDDYSRTLFLHPADARRDPNATQPTGDFKRSIEKAQKAIQLRSIKKRPAKKSGKSNDPKYKEWMRREEYNPFLHNAWLMMGRSQYMNGDFLGAASTFYYISKHFSWLPDAVTESKLWQARSYCSMGWNYEAENIMNKIKTEELTSDNLKELYNYNFANFHVMSGNYEAAIPYLIEAIKLSGGAQKSRLRFLLGQLYSMTGKKAEAYKAFKSAAGSGTTYRTQFNARIKQSEVFMGDDIEPEVKSLKRMTRYDRNKDYLDQIYYAIGNLYLSRQDTVNAIANYVLAAEKSTRNGIDKAISQITLGNLYFKQHRYELAQPCFAEAVPLLPETYPDYETLKRRSDVLDELAVYSGNVTLNDSLLRLSEMTPEQQKEIIEKIIEELKKKEKEEEERLKREEYLAQNAQGDVQNTGNAASTPMTFNMNNDDSWYFYNTASKNAGKTAFQKRWGARKLEDDWRRRNKASFDFNDFGESDNDASDNEDMADDAVVTDSVGNELTEEEKERIKREEDPHFVEYYLKQIPKTNEEKLIANDIIQEGMFNMGLILKDKLDDYASASDVWIELLSRYPDNIYRLDVYYNMYLMYMRLGDRAKAEQYRKLILSDFADSKYGQAMQDPEYLEKLKNMDEEQEKLYASAYEAYLNNRNDEVHAAYEDMMKRYPLSKIMPKFMFIDALSYVTEKNADKFKATLTELLQRYPDTDMTPLASAYLKGLAQGRKLQSGTANLRGMLWNLRLSNDSAAVASDSISFDLNPAEPQMLVLVFPTDVVSSNQLLYDVARHNFASFVVRDFDIEQMNFGRLGLLIIKGFGNFEELAHYRKVMDSNNQLRLPADVRPVMISVSNFNTLIQQGSSFEEYFRYVDEQAAEEPVVAGPGNLENETSTYQKAISGDQPQEIVQSDTISIEQSMLEIEDVKRDTVVLHHDTVGVVESSVPPTSKLSTSQVVSPNKPDSVVLNEKKPKTTKSKTKVMPSANQPAVKPAMPEYPVGSEGEDDLLD